MVVCLVNYKNGEIYQKVMVKRQGKLDHRQIMKSILRGIKLKQKEKWKNKDIVYYVKNHLEFYARNTCWREINGEIILCRK